MINNNNVKGRKKIRTTSKLLMSVSAFSIAMAMGSVSALAQQADDQEIEEITVTGSRLIRRDLNAPSPVTVISDANIRSSGNVTLEETLNEMPQLAADNTSSVNSGGGSGVLTADLRGLGANRTLVLVNGRRFTPANESGLVDLSSIPDALVQSVEIITGGASAVYGSDAIAGAVNFKLRDDFEGMEVSYNYGKTFKGDAKTHKIDATFGGNFADGRGNAVMSGSYTSRGGIWFEDRDFSAISLFENGGELVPGGSSNIPGTRLSLNTADLAALQGVNFGSCAAGSSVRGVLFSPSGEPLPFCDPQDRFNFANGNYLLRPLQRFQISALGHYDVTENITAYSELFYMDNINEWQQAPNAGGLSTNGAPRGELWLPDYATNTALFPAFRDFLSANAWKFDPDGDGKAIITGTGRRFVESGHRNYKYERASLALTGGFRGNFELFEGTWNWDSFYQYQRARTDSNIAGQISSVRMSLGLDVIPDPDNPGQMICRNAFSGCVPVNPFGVDSLTPEMAAFISPNHGNTTVLERQVFGGFVSGSLFELPAGSVDTAFGVEHRRENFEFLPDGAEQGGEFGNPSFDRVGNVELTEFYVEARIPLIRDAGWADYFGLEIAARSSDYSNIGTVNTWKVGGEWVMTDWIRLRGAYNVAIRAPSLNELYSPVGIGFTAGDDRCDQDFNPTAAQQALCVAQGVPAADIADFQHNNVGFGVESGGNPMLFEEKSDTWTLGAVINVPQVDGLNLTVDYYSINIDDAIAGLNAQYVVDTCFAKVDINSIECQAIVRTSDGQIDYVKAPISNIASEKATGVDVQVDYGYTLPEVFAVPGNEATLDIALLSSWIIKSEQTPLPGATPVDCAGIFGSSCSGFARPMQASSKQVASLRYTSGPLGMRFQARRMAGFTHAFPADTNVMNTIPATVYLDLSFTYLAREHYEFFGGIDNMTDREPPIMGFSLAGDANVDIALYDTLGRRFFAGVRAKF